MFRYTSYTNVLQTQSNQGFARFRSYICFYTIPTPTTPNHNSFAECRTQRRGSFQIKKPPLCIFCLTLQHLNAQPEVLLRERRFLVTAAQCFHRILPVFVQTQISHDGFIETLFRCPAAHLINILLRRLGGRSIIRVSKNIVHMAYGTGSAYSVARICMFSELPSSCGSPIPGYHLIS